MAKAEVKMAVDPFRVIARALKRSRKHPHLGKIVSVDYDEEAMFCTLDSRTGRLLTLSLWMTKAWS